MDYGRRGASWRWPGGISRELLLKTLVKSLSSAIHLTVVSVSVSLSVVDLTVCPDLRPGVWREDETGETISTHTPVMCRDGILNSINFCETFFFFQQHVQITYKSLEQWWASGRKWSDKHYRHYTHMLKCVKKKKLCISDQINIIFILFKRSINL